MKRDIDDTKKPYCFKVRLNLGLLEDGGRGQDRTADTRILKKIDFEFNFLI
jgi:hypothetical protein